MELTGGAASRTMGGDEKSECMREEVGSGYSVRVERWVRRDEDDLQKRERPWMLGLEMRLNITPKKAWEENGEPGTDNNGNDSTAAR